MQPGLLDKENLTSIPFDALSGYEKGAVARALLNDFIKEASLERDPSDSRPGEVLVTIQKWQLEILARFNQEDESEKADDDKEILLDALCQTR